MKFSNVPGATTIDLDSARDLIPPLTTQEQLNEFEQTNITAAMEWAIKSRKLKSSLLKVDGILLLHRSSLGSFEIVVTPSARQRSIIRGEARNF